MKMVIDIYEITQKISMAAEITGDVQRQREGENERVQASQRVPR